MIEALRTNYNQSFRSSHYDDLQKKVLETFGEPCAFRISETPIFIEKKLKTRIFEACDAIISQLDALDFEAVRQRFMPADLEATTPTENPHFLGIDFALTEDGSGEIKPKLIELQAFPSLYCYQLFLGKAMRKIYPAIPDNLHYLFSNLEEGSYLQRLRQVIIGDENPENVVLMEIHPDKQKTRIDFTATKQMLGIEVVCITEIVRKGDKLYYEKEGKLTPINRIYNRVIYDDLKLLPDLNLEFTLFDDLDVHWITHPDWFFTISKCIMPLLSHSSIPHSYYLEEVPEDIDLSQYVLKPLFSFAGRGININPTKEALEGISDKGNYILQQKVTYAPLIKTLTEKNSRVEIRILYLINPETKVLEPVINLVRMGKEGLINVSHQTQETWIGSSIAFFEE